MSELGFPFVPTPAEKRGRCRESLSGVESLIELPAAITHSSIAGSPFAVSDSLIRLSVGMEAVEDLVEDLAAVLE